MSGSCGWFPMGRDEIRAWVEAHKDSLPQTLAELSAFPIPFRKVIVNFVSAEARAALWREHLSSFVGDASNLSREQQAFVAEAAAILPTLLAAPAPNPVMTDWESQAIRVFSRQEMRRIFGTLGPPEPPEGLPLPPDAQPRPR
jgi:hypothetical protein